jgi:hypothetical protein
MNARPFGHGYDCSHAAGGSKHLPLEAALVRVLVVLSPRAFILALFTEPLPPHARGLSNHTKHPRHAALASRASPKRIPARDAHAQ